MGPEGTFSHLAAREIFGLAARYVEAATIEGVFDAVRRAVVELGVVPIENSSEGSVTYAVDANLEGGLLIRSEAVIEGSHCLHSTAGRLTAVERVYSHPQALSQCRAWLAKYLGQAQLVQTASTAGATREAAADPAGAAVGSRLAGELSGLPVLRESIQDRAGNATRFVVIAREDAPRTGADKTTLGFSLRDEPGALHRALAIFDAAGVNLTRIESRPSKRAPWEYVFLVDLEGHRDDEAVASVVRELSARCESVQHLGSYPRAAGTTGGPHDHGSLYQGVDGAYSDVLLHRHFGARGEEVETVGLPTFRDVAVALLAGRGRYGGPPLENTVAGTFSARATTCSRSVRPDAGARGDLPHGSPAPSASPALHTAAGLTRIEAHPMVLEECGRFLATLPGARPVPALDTGVAARDVAEAEGPGGRRHRPHRGRRPLRPRRAWPPTSATTPTTSPASSSGRGRPKGDERTPSGGRRPAAPRSSSPPPTSTASRRAACWSSPTPA